MTETQGIDARRATRGNDKGPGIYECTKKSDCGRGFDCCSIRELDTYDESPNAPPIATPHATQCRYGCDSQLFDDVCEQTNECPSGMAFGANGGAYARTCKRRPASKSYPAWLGRCE